MLCKERGKLFHTAIAGSQQGEKPTMIVIIWPLRLIGGHYNMLVTQLLRVSFILNARVINIKFLVQSQRLKVVEKIMALDNNEASH